MLGSQTWWYTRVRYLVSVRTDILLANPEMFDDVVTMVLSGLKEVMMMSNQ